MSDWKISSCCRIKPFNKRSKKKGTVLCVAWAGLSDQMFEINLLVIKEPLRFFFIDFFHLLLLLFHFIFICSLFFISCFFHVLCVLVSFVWCLLVSTAAPICEERASSAFEVILIVIRQGAGMPLVLPYDLDGMLMNNALETVMSDRCPSINECLFDAFEICIWSSSLLHSFAMLCKTVSCAFLLLCLFFCCCVCKTSK